MEPIYIAQADSASRRRFTERVGGSLLWLSLLPLPLGLGMLGGWTVRDWSGDASVAPAVAECPACQEETGPPPWGLPRPRLIQVTPFR